ncbi:MAG: Ig-like domain repeat protein [Candidatus Methanosuratincola sp.]
MTVNATPFSVGAITNSDESPLVPPPDFDDNFDEDSGAWTYTGIAHRDSENGYVVLASNANYMQGGAIWLNCSFNSSFNLSFMYKAGGGSGADGFVMMFYKDTSLPLPGAGYLCFSGADYDAAGYGIEFDNYRNVWDPSDNHVALIKDHIKNHMYSVDDMRTEDYEWHRVNVTVSSSSVVVYIDDEKLFCWNGTLDRTYGGFGFGAGVGTFNNWAIIDNLSIRAPSEPVKTTVEVTCSPNPANVTLAITCIAIVNGSNPTGTITWTSNSTTGSFSPSNCTLTSGNCSSTYTDTTPGTAIITASYSGDSNNEPSNGTATLTVLPLPIRTLFLNLVGMGTDAVGTVLSLGRGWMNITRGEFNLSVWFYEGAEIDLSWTSTVSAGAGKRYVWVSTTGDSTGKSGMILFGSENATLTGHYKAQYYVDSSSGSGGAVSLASGWYDAGAKVPITATPASGHTFGGWITSGGVSISSTSSQAAMLTINGPGSVRATFQILPVGVTFIHNGVWADYAGPVLTVDGTSVQLYELPKTYFWYVASNHSFSWLSPLNASPVKRYVWVATSGLSSDQSGTIITPSGAGPLTGIYSTEYYVAVESPLGGTTDPYPGGWYKAGQSVSISAAPSYGYAFANWTATGEVSIADVNVSSTTFTVSGPGTVRANFAQLPVFNLTILASSGGSTNPSGSGDYPVGTVVNASAEPSPGHRFAGWTAEGNITVSNLTSSTIAITVTGPGSVTANFAPIDTTPPTISGLSPGNGTKVASGAVTISASFSDPSGINASSVSLTVDGVPAAGAQATASGITYSCTLQPGTHTAAVTVSDTEGNSRTATWSFTVEAQTQAFPVEYAVLAAVAVAAVAAAAFLIRKRRTSIKPS